MSVQLIGRNTAAFADGWLDIVKVHCRVDFEDDDDYLRVAIVRAADYVERETGRAIIPTAYLWRPESGEAASWADVGAAGASIEGSNRCGCGGGWRYPAALSAIGPIVSFRVTKGGEDISPMYEVVGAVSPGLPGPQFLVASGGVLDRKGGPEPANKATLVTVTVGFADPAATPASLVDAVLLVTAHLYENREASANAFRSLPNIAQAYLSTLWIPRC